MTKNEEKLAFIIYKDFTFTVKTRKKLNWEKNLSS